MNDDGYYTCVRLVYGIYGTQTVTVRYSICNTAPTRMQHACIDWDYMHVRCFRGERQGNWSGHMFNEGHDPCTIV